MSLRMLPLAVIASCAVACAGNAERARAFVDSGDRYIASGQLDAAVIEYRNAVKRNSASAEAQRKLGDAYVALGKSEDAYRAYSTAVELDPSDTRSYIGAGRLLLSVGMYDEANVRAEQALDYEPRNVDAMVLAGRALARLSRVAESTGAFQTAIATDPQPAAFIGLGDLKRSSGDIAGAEAAYRQAVALHPQSVDARIALAQFLMADRPAEAEQNLLKAVKANPADELANRSVASFYISADRRPEAEPFLAAAAAQPNQKLRSTLALADFCMTAGRRDDARAILTRVNGENAQAVGAKVRLAALDYEAGQKAEAHQRLDKILKKTPTGEAWTAKARFLASEHKLDEALKAAHAAVDFDRRIATAHYIIGSIELENGNYDEAEHAFREVLRLKKTTTAATLQLARTKLAAGKTADAVALAQSAGSALGARLTLARALIADGQIATARNELLQLEVESTKSADPSVLLGSLELDGGNIDAALEHAGRALSAAPDSVDALLLMARTALSAEDGVTAEQYLNRAVAIAPASFDANALLAQLYVIRGDVARARKTFESLAARSPHSAEARTAVGILLQAEGRDRDARGWYEQALAVDPNQAIAANNLARLYASDRSNLDAAVRLAQLAEAKLPNERQVRETVRLVDDVRRAVADAGRDTTADSIKQ
jgi:tetratricopeptide (TPR) repeat protein